MIDTTKIKDGLILLLIAGVAIGGYFVARRVIDGVGSIGQGAGEVLDNIKAGIADAGAAIANTAQTAVSPLSPSIQHSTPSPTKTQAQADWENHQLDLMAAGGMGA